MHRCQCRLPGSPTIVIKYLHIFGGAFLIVCSGGWFFHLFFFIRFSLYLVYLAFNQYGIFFHFSFYSSIFRRGNLIFFHCLITRGVLIHSCFCFRFKWLEAHFFYSFLDLFIFLRLLCLFNFWLRMHVLCMWHNFQFPIYLQSIVDRCFQCKVCWWNSNSEYCCVPIDEKEG